MGAVYGFSHGLLQDYPVCFHDAQFILIPLILSCLSLILTTEQIKAVVYEEDSHFCFRQRHQCPEYC